MKSINDEFSYVLKMLPQLDKRSTLIAKNLFLVGVLTGIEEGRTKTNRPLAKLVGDIQGELERIGLALDTSQDNGVH